MLASYMLLATYLAWDLRDLKSGRPLEGDAAKRRIRSLAELLGAAERGAGPVFDPRMPREQRLEKWTSRKEDEQKLRVVRTAFGRVGDMKVDYFVERGRTVLCRLEERGWRWPTDRGDQVFIEEYLLPFLRRLERISEAF